MMRGALATRLATPADAAAIAAIYNEGIADRIATFETDPRTAAQIEAQLRDKGDRSPTVVAERDGQPRAPRALRVPRGGRLPAPR